MTAKSKMHDANGRFAKGNPGGPGRPPNPPPIELPPDYLAIVEDGVDVQQWRDIVSKAVQQAKTGNRAARDWLTRILVDNPQLGSRDATMRVEWRDVTVRKTYGDGSAAYEVRGHHIAHEVNLPRHRLNDPLDGVPEQYKSGIRAWLDRAPASPGGGVVLNWNDLPLTHHEASREWYVSLGFIDPFDDELDRPLPNPAAHPNRIDALPVPPAPQDVATDVQESETPETPETPPAGDVEPRIESKALSTLQGDQPVDDHVRDDTGDTDGDTDGGTFGKTNGAFDGWAKRFS